MIDMIDKEIIGGWLGSVTGYVIAEKMNYDLPMTIGMISIGHMTGHYIGSKLSNPSNAPVLGFLN